VVEEIISVRKLEICSTFKNVVFKNYVSFLGYTENFMNAVSEQQLHYFLQIHTEKLLDGNADIAVTKKLVNIWKLNEGNARKEKN
jgi:hypothetical protein